MREFKPYKILLSLFDILNVFYDGFWINIEVKMSQIMLIIQILSWNMLKMSDKLNTIWLKRLNSHIFKDEWLNW